MKRLLGLAALPWLVSCAAPISGVWPPRPGEPTYRLDVAQDAWHSIIRLWPETDPGGRSPGKGQEWGFADRSYYLEGHDGLTGCCGALFWPTAGVLQVAPGGVSLQLSEGDHPRRWTFAITAEGRRRLIAFLENEKGSVGPFSHAVGSDWYEARSTYHAFHHCSQWTARAVRAAGLPVWSGYALFGWSLALQLDRAAGWR